MYVTRNSNSYGVLLSGGLNSSILLAHLVGQGHNVQPFYIRSDVVWQEEELTSVHQFLNALDSPNVAPLVVLDLPLSDVYREHWSVTGEEVPDAKSADEAVYLPGRNTLLIVKAALWCQLNGIDQLALATLSTSPFDDATDSFFDELAGVLNRGANLPLRIVSPFDGMEKHEVINLGHDVPLELTFSCLSPVDGLHCGTCNKCAERQSAFRSIGREDRADYACEFTQQVG